MSEIWKSIEGCKGYYEVSSFGRVKSLPRRVPCGSGRETRLVPEKILANSRRGYTFVQLRIDGMEYRESVHRLVTEAFIPNPKGLPFVNHKDGDKTNNRADNLEWCTPKENINHALGMGLMRFVGSPGEKNGKSRLTQSQVNEIKAMCLDGKSQRSASRKFGVSSQHVGRIVRGTRWKSIQEAA